MYELLTNTVVYNVNDIDGLVDKMDNFSIKAAFPHIPERLEQIMMKCLEVDQEQRYQNAKELVSDLEQYMYGDKYGPTNEKLSRYLLRLFPWENPDGTAEAK